MSCRSCGAEVQGAACAYCGTPVEPEAVRAAAPGVAGCPRCQDSTALHRHVLDGAAVHGCPRCGGIWVPAETLEPLVEAGARRLAPEKGGAGPQRVSGSVQYLRCPQCDAHMARRNYARVSGVIIDACPDHGVWLDRGELEAMRRFVASGGRARQARAEAEKERVESQLRELRRRQPGQGSLLGDLGAGFGPWGSGLH